jgi:hypothetical protein
MVQWETASEKRSQQNDPFRKDKLSGEEPNWEVAKGAKLQAHRWLSPSPQEIDHALADFGRLSRFTPTGPLHVVDLQVTGALAVSGCHSFSAGNIAGNITAQRCGPCRFRHLAIDLLAKLDKKWRNGP